MTDRKPGNFTTGGARIGGRRNRTAEYAARVLKAFRSRAEMSFEELLAATRLTHNTLRKAIYHLRDSGRLVMRHYNGRGSRAFYSIGSAAPDWRLERTEAAGEWRTDAIGEALRAWPAEHRKVEAGNE